MKSLGMGNETQNLSCVCVNALRLRPAKLVKHSHTSTRCNECQETPASLLFGDGIRANKSLQVKVNGVFRGNLDARTSSSFRWLVWTGRILSGQVIGGFKPWAYPRREPGSNILRRGRLPARNRPLRTTIDSGQLRDKSSGASASSR